MNTNNNRLIKTQYSSSNEKRNELDVQRHRAEFLKIEKRNQTPVTPRASGVENIFRLQTSVDLQYVTDESNAPLLPYREAVCALCEKTVSLALNITLESLQAKTRCNAEIALARQIAMYLCHTTFSLLLTEVGLHFGRDRTTVSYACALIEDKRDDPEFDLLLNQLESLLVDARQAMSICVEHRQDEDEAPTVESTAKSRRRNRYVFTSETYR